MDPKTDPTKRLAALAHLSNELSHGVNAKDLASLVCRRGVEHFGLEDCVVYSLDPRQDLLVQQAACCITDPHGRVLTNPLVIPVGEGIVGSAARTGQPELVADTASDGRYILDDQCRRSELAIPIIHAGEVVGVLDSEHPAKSFFDDQDIAFLTTLSALLAPKMIQRIEKHSDLRLPRSLLPHLDHELRTPLGSILGHRRTLFRGGGMPPSGSGLARRHDSRPGHRSHRGSLERNAGGRDRLKSGDGFALSQFFFNFSLRIPRLIFRWFKACALSPDESSGYPTTSGTNTPFLP